MGKAAVLKAVDIHFLYAKIRPQVLLLSGHTNTIQSDIKHIDTKRLKSTRTFGFMNTSEGIRHWRTIRNTDVDCYFFLDLTLSISGFVITPRFVRMVISQSASASMVKWVTRLVKQSSLIMNRLFCSLIFPTFFPKLGAPQ